MRLVKHKNGKTECYGSGYPVKDLAEIHVGNAVDYSTRPSTVRLGDKRWLCPECEQAIKAE